MFSLIKLEFRLGHRTLTITNMRGGGLDDYFARRNTQIPAVFSSQQVSDLLEDQYFSMLLGKLDFKFIEAYVKYLRRRNDSDELDLESNLDDLVGLTVTHLNSF